MTNPSLQDVRRRRQQIRELLTSLNEEDRELYAAEKTLMRLGGLGDTPPIPAPLPWAAPLPPPPTSPANALSSAFLGTAQVPPNVPPPPPPANALLQAIRDLPEDEVEEEEEEEEEQVNDGGAGLVEIVKKAMTGNENLEQLTLLLFESCSDTWWTATEIQDYLTRIKGKEVPMGSISPMLTALKNNGTITRNGHNVALVTKAQEEALR
ncbi:hypothetical protein [Bradyrhizobium liaoningense]|uniref:hypothetical protein n=1 Tax=Bradyrhizobium liaoningense TaxID=43992 RepID=UPI001BA9598B|nr:hypothetical protein [Bradyrhizobium liaoningense]